MWLAKDIGIDLGTCSVLVYVQGKGIVLREPSVVAYEKSTNKLLEVGRKAHAMLGRTPDNIVAVRPLSDGVISRYGITMEMLKHFIRQSIGITLFHPRIAVCVPSGITEVEQRAVVDASTSAGAKRTYLIEEPLAAAIGAGIDINQPDGHMIVDIGGGTTDIAVLALGGVVESDSIKVAGDKFDAAIARHVRNRYDLLIGDQTAELLKVKIGCAYPRPQPLQMQVKGRSLVSGLPQVVNVSSLDIPDALESPITSVVEAILGVIEKTPPELMGDIIRNGIIMTGGGSLLFGLDKLLYEVTHIKTRVAQNPISCVALGTGRALEMLDANSRYVTDEGLIRFTDRQL